MDRRIDALYGLPLDEFTAARNALARELKDEGIRALVKPSQVAWAINQAARADKVSVRRLLKAADVLRARQEKALAGKDVDLAGAQHALREAVRALARAAPAGHADRVERTLTSAALDPAARELLAAGRLTEELAPAGFDALAGMKLPPPRATPAKPKRDEAKERRRRELRAAAQAAERRALELERAAARARHTADEAAAALAALDD